MTTSEVKKSQAHLATQAKQRANEAIGRRTKKIEQRAARILDGISHEILRLADAEFIGPFFYMVRLNDEIEESAWPLVTESLKIEGYDVHIPTQELRPCSCEESADKCKCQVFKAARIFPSDH